MKKATKIFLNISLALGLVFLSIRPSLTNRIAPAPASRCSSAEAASTFSIMSFPSKDIHYRGSFWETEEENLGHSFLPVAISPYQGFAAPKFNFASRACLSAGPIPSKKYSILRI